MVDNLLAGDRAATPRTLVDVLADVTARHPDAPALDDTVTVLTYTELTEQARRMAKELKAAGVRRGDRVGVRVPSGTTEMVAPDPTAASAIAKSPSSTRGAVPPASVTLRVTGPPDPAPSFAR